jgi:endo-1,4-beta-D-glucanase Y
MVFQKLMYIAIISALLCYDSIFAELLPIASSLPRVSKSYDTIILKTWQGIKKRNIDPYSVKLIHRPKSEFPHDAVSEGVGYGMLWALYCNDQEYFNKIWFAAEQYMWAGEFYNWRVDQNGKVEGTGAASDAEEDIAIALIFADQLVKKSIWTLTNKTASGTTYEARARSILESIKRNMLEGSYLRPGAGWGGAAFVNPGYFAPAWYKVFAEYDQGSKTVWENLINQCYQTINLSPGFSKGLIPDWLKPDGQYNATPLGYNPTGDGKWLYKDAIRVYWRLATDYLWYDEQRAKPFLQNAMKFIVSPSRSNFYQMDGSLVTGTYKLGNSTERQHTEHSHLTIGMWACASMVSGLDEAEKFSDELLTFYDGGDYWGKAADPNNEDTLHNEMYFDQFLAFFGASLISGIFTNIWDDIKKPNLSIPLEWKTIPSLNTANVNADNGPLKITAELNIPVRWSVVLKKKDNPNESVTFSDNSSRIDIAWYGLSDSGKAMSQGFYDVTVTAKGLNVPTTFEVWLGKSISLLVNNRLIVDDFRDGDLNPFFGNVWTSYLDSYDGKTGASSVKKLAVETNGNQKQLVWSYLLNAGSLGYDPYAAVELNCVKNSSLFNMTGVDTIIITASANRELGVSFQVVTDDIVKSGTFSYYDDSLYLTTSPKEFRIPVTRLKQRFGGSMKFDPAQVTAIRMQVQQKSGSEGSITISSIQFTGNIASLYTAPPEYKENSSITTTPKQRMNRSLWTIGYSTKDIKIVLYKQFTGEIHIVNSLGREIYRKHYTNTKNIVVDSKMLQITKGYYIVTLSSQNGHTESESICIVR